MPGNGHPAAEHRSFIDEHLYDRCLLYNNYLFAVCTNAFFNAVQSGSGSLHIKAGKIVTPDCRFSHLFACRCVDPLTTK